MIDPILNHAAGGVVARGHRISFVRLGATQSMDLAELHQAASRLASSLAALGLGPGDRLGILAANSVEWVLLDLAALRLKVVTAGFEPGKFELESLPAKYGLKMLFTDRPFDAGLDSRGVIRPIGEVAALSAEPAVEPVVSAPGFAWHEPTTIKFTSGSSGEPKGLAATAGSIDSSVSAVQELFRHGADDNLFIFLPLSLLQQRFWIYSALYYGHDVTVSTYEAALPSLRRVRPTVVMGVPAFYEAAMAHIEAQARRAGADASAVRAAAADPDASAVRSAAQNLFGDRIRYLWTGSAPARAAMLRFFTDAGLPLYEGYGLNEACIVAKNHPGAHCEGSVGQVLPRKKVLFDQDGVISIHSEYPVNDRYEYAPPGESERMFLPGDVVRTGDVGYLDPDGFLYIQGRADDTIVLDNGRKVIVRPIEERLRASPSIAECVVFCPDQTRLVAVISPPPGPLDEAAITDHIAQANAEAAADEQITRVVMAQPPFSIENGLLTSQYKPRRPQIYEAYRDRITATHQAQKEA